jgi:hypothetical protein
VKACVREREREGREVMSKKEVGEREREWLYVSEYEKKREGE